MRHSGPESGPGFHAKFLQTLYVVLFLRRQHCGHVDGESPAPLLYHWAARGLPASSEFTPLNSIWCLNTAPYIPHPIPCALHHCWLSQVRFILGRNYAGSQWTVLSCIPSCGETFSGWEDFRHYTRQSARWSTKVSFPLNFRVLRDQICTARGPQVDCVRQVDF